MADQLEEAKKLKQNIDKRSFTVLSMLQKYLSDQLQGVPASHWFEGNLKSVWSEISVNWNMDFMGSTEPINGF